MNDIMDIISKSVLLEEEVSESGFWDGFDNFPPAPEDVRIAEIANKQKVRIKIVGCGGGGCNTVERLNLTGVNGAELVAVNTDAKHLLSLRTRKKMLIGRNLMGGDGTGAEPKIGENCALEDIIPIQKMTYGTDITFITCGLGGGTGTGASPVIAKSAKDAGSTVISIVTLPFKSEGDIRMENALNGLEKLAQYSDTVIAIPNDKLLEEVPGLSIETAFGYADTLLGETIKGMTELITLTGIINVDYADVKAVMKDGGVAMVGTGESNVGDDRVLRAINEAMTSRLVEADISDARNCIVRIIGGYDMTVSEAESATNEVQKRINPNAKIIWGASVERFYNKKIRVLVLLTGVKSPYMLANRADAKQLRKLLAGDEQEQEIDIVS
ncbi:MAG: cell division protein FtsZ [Candidatus Thermoplasmatota archaeon]|jgi:cell division protein FtsZ|nr:cell division protein FtsZ [Candidatus Thermoplasmatota archaeon]MCL5667415.1 cell division protein FtsZ [Candidatus Thermoplasmatota archaeon]